MDWDRLRENRARAVQRMNDSLEDIRPVGLPLWVCDLVTFLIFILLVVYYAGGMAWLMLRMLVEAAVFAIMTPFRVAWLFADIVIITFWYMRVVSVKMSQRKP